MSPGVHLSYRPPTVPQKPANDPILVQQSPGDVEGVWMRHCKKLPFQDKGSKLNPAGLKRRFLHFRRCYPEDGRLHHGDHRLTLVASWLRTAAEAASLLEALQAAQRPPGGP